MKNYLKGIITGIIIGAAVCPANVLARVTGTVLSTNIGTVIDGAACKTYNVDGRTFVVAEDLRGYGFDVDWNESTRNLNITQNPYAHRTLLSKEEVNIKKEDCPVGNPLMDILSSDVTVTVAGEKAEGYNIDGQMVIPVRALEPYAYIEFDEENRLVKIQGLKHYLDTRYAEGNPNVTRDIKEYVQHVFDEQRTLGGGLYSQDSYDVNVKEIATTDTENGKLYSYFGNPLTVFVPTSLNHCEECYDREIYSVTDKDGEWIYEADLLYRNDTGFRYIITTDKAQHIDSGYQTLYGYEVKGETNHYNTWPCDDEINKSDIRFDKFVLDGAITQDGYFYKLYTPFDEEKHMKRFNISDVTSYHNYEGPLLLARDNVLYHADHYYYYGDSFYTNSRENPKASSMFDSEIKRDVKKAVLDYILYLSGDLYYKDEKILSDVYNIALYYNSRNGEFEICALYENGEAYIGSAEDYRTGNGKKLADNVKKVYDYSYVTAGMSANDIHYVTKDDMLRKYSINYDRYEDVADNVYDFVQQEPFGKETYISTDGILVRDGEKIMSDVKAAAYTRYEQKEEKEEKGRTVTYSTTKYGYYIIKNDGTLWYFADNEPSRVKAFE